MAKKNNSNVRVWTTFVAGLFLASATAFAHHGTNINYDGDAWQPVKGTVTKFVMQNPHSRLYLDVKDEKGNIVHFAIEGPGGRGFEVSLPGGDDRTGRHLFQPGDAVTMRVHPSRFGAPVGECGQLVQCQVTINGQAVKAKSGMQAGAGAE